MAKKASTDIKFTEIKKKAKQANAKETYEFEDGSTLSFYPTFPPSMIESMFEEVQSILKPFGDDLDMSEKDLDNYIKYMMIKHFTHLKSQLKADNLAEQINEMNSIIDSGYFDVILNEVFIPSEMYKVYDQAAKFSAQFLFLQNMTDKMHDEVAKLELKNADVFKNINVKKQIPEV